MEITEVRIKLPGPNLAGPRLGFHGRLLAYATVVLDGEFVVRDLKLISGPNRVFVAMPNRMLAAGCPTCGHKNTVAAKFCSGCGRGLPRATVTEGDDLYADVCFPSTAEARRAIEVAVAAAYRAELERVQAA